MKYVFVTVMFTVFVLVLAVAIIGAVAMNNLGLNPFSKADIQVWFARIREQAAPPERSSTVAIEKGTITDIFATFEKATDDLSIDGELRRMPGGEIILDVSDRFYDSATKRAADVSVKVREISARHAARKPHNVA